MKVKTCKVCGKEIQGKRAKYCSDECMAEAGRMRSKLKAKLLKLNNICQRCGKNEPIEGKTICRECADYLARKTSEAKSNNKCPLCHTNDVEDGKRICSSCKAVAEARVERLQSEGKCINCGSVKTPNAAKSNFCIKCWMKAQAGKVLGDVNKWHLLMDKWEKQGGKCFYTGVELEFGGNRSGGVDQFKTQASIDHILPKHSHPNFKDDINNIVFCSRWANCVKNYRRDVVDTVKRITELNLAKEV